MTARGIEPGDVCIDLAQGTTVQVVDVAAESVDEWQMGHNYDLLGNYANARLGATPHDRVYTCVYANSIQSEPSKAYDFPETRLARIEHESATGERVQDVLAVELLADLFEAANATTNDPWPADLDQLVRDTGIRQDVHQAASELGETRSKERDAE